MKSVFNTTIIICSIVRNAEKGLIRNIPIINELCESFKDYRIIVYENDSTDKTKEILRKWNSENPDKIHISINDTDATPTIPSSKTTEANPFFCRQRIEKMARLRNKYMDYVNRQAWKADYLMVVDLDVAQLYLQGILSSFHSSVNWDAVTAFGYSTSPKLKRRYHDTYALTVWGDENEAQTESKIKLWADRLGNLKKTDEWIKIYSAFGGLAIYKFEAINKLRYKVLPNRDTRVEVKCEHFSIYKQMIENGYDKFYINPAMSLKYQALTPTIFWNSFKRFISSFNLTFRFK